MITRARTGESSQRGPAGRAPRADLARGGGARRARRLLRARARPLVAGGRLHARRAPPGPTAHGGHALGIEGVGDRLKRHPALAHLGDALLERGLVLHRAAAARGGTTRGRARPRPLLRPALRGEAAGGAAARSVAAGAEVATDPGVGPADGARMIQTAPPASTDAPRPTRMNPRSGAPPRHRRRAWRQRPSEPPPGAWRPRRPPGARPGPDFNRVLPASSGYWRTSSRGGCTRSRARAAAGAATAKRQTSARARSRPEGRAGRDVPCTHPACHRSGGAGPKSPLFRSFPDLPRLGRGG